MSAHSIDPRAYTRPPGVDDVGPERHEDYRVVEEALLDTLASFGCRQVAAPVVEYRDLYDPERVGLDMFHHLVLARLGEPAAFPGRGGPGELFDGGELSHDAALRPDLTTPLARMYIGKLLDGRLGGDAPVRWSCAGPVFRAHPDADQPVEFRQVGAEILGPSGGAADLELLHATTAAAARVGLPDAVLYIGHADLFRQILRAARVPETAVAAVANGIVAAARLRLRLALGGDGLAGFVRQAAVRVHGAIAVRARSQGRSAPPSGIAAVGGDSDGVDAHVDMLPERWEAHLLDVWREAHGVEPTQGRRLLRLATLGLKWTNDGQPLRRVARGRLSGAFEHLDELVGALVPGGTPDPVVAGLRADLAATARIMAEEYGELPIILTPAASRGIAYYSGIAFELHAPGAPGVSTELAAGGRYDRLLERVAARARATAVHRGASPSTLHQLGAGALQGVGVAFQVERIAATAQLTGRGSGRLPAAVSARPEAPGPVVRALATALRGRGWGVSMARGPSPEPGQVHVHVLNDQQAQVYPSDGRAPVTVPLDRVPAAMSGEAP